ncbi:MAG: hypothetical protein V4736_07010 [Bdellovibrionota bacterium]
MKTLILALTLVSSGAFGASKLYQIQADLTLNGKPISSSSVVAKAGERAKISQTTDGEESYIEVVADESTIPGKKAIHMKFNIGVVGKDGMQKFSSQPSIIANDNQQAKVTGGKEGSAEYYTLAVKAKRLVK